MKKIIKYDIKATYKFILGILIIAILASTVMQVKVQMEISNGTSLGILDFSASILLAFILIIVGSYLIALFYIIGSFRKELYSGGGCLAFSPPLTGNQILGSKLIVSLLWYIILGAGIIIYNLSLALILFENDWKYLMNTILTNLDISFVSLGAISTLSTVVTLILIYFSIVLSKVSIKNKRAGGMWFILFIVLNVIITFMTFKISTYLPYYLSLGDFSIKHIYNITTIMPRATDSLMALGNDSNALMFLGNNFKPYVNVFGNLFQLLVVIIGFLGTGYLIERKVDV